MATFPHFAHRYPAMIGIPPDDDPSGILAHFSEAAGDRVLRDSASPPPSGRAGPAG
jgi:hypothetical protein